MKKKLLLIGGVLFVAVILQLMFGTNVNAKTTYNSEISYEENYDGTIKVMAAGEYIESATIPSTINGKPVTEVADSGFRNCKYLKTVTLPSSITEIGSNAFAECTKVDRLLIPSTVEKIGSEAFKRNSFGLRNQGKNITLRCYPGSKAIEYARLNNLGIEQA